MGGHPTIYVSSVKCLTGATEKARFDSRKSSGGRKVRVVVVVVVEERYDVKSRGTTAAQRLRRDCLAVWKVRRHPRRLPPSRAVSRHLAPSPAISHRRSPSLTLSRLRSPSPPRRVAGGPPALRRALARGAPVHLPRPRTAHAARVRRPRRRVGAALRRRQGGLGQRRASRLKVAPALVEDSAPIAPPCCSGGVGPGSATPRVPRQLRSLGGRGEGG